MKNYLSLLLAFSFIGSIGAQNDAKVISHYIFPEFKKGIVLLRDSTEEDYMLNLNAITEKMIFQRGGQNLEIAFPSKVDTVFIEDMKFVPVNGIFYEISFITPVEFYIEHKCTVIPAGKPAGYGTTTETGSATAITTLTGRGQVNFLKLPEEYDISPYKMYWIKKDGKFYGANSSKQLEKIYPDKKAAIKDYLKENKTNFKKREEVEKLIKAIFQ